MGVYFAIGIQQQANTEQLFDVHKSIITFPTRFARWSVNLMKKQLSLNSKLNYGLS
jgi:hypothetical protein